MRWVVVGFALACLVVAPAAHADDKTHKRALELAGQSAESYKAGRFDEAIAELREAVDLEPDPVLIFNLARVYESSGDLDHAVESFRRYLDASAHAEDRGAVEQRITTLERQIQEREDARRKKDPAAQGVQGAPSPVTHERPKSASPAPWVVFGAGALGLGAGTVLAFVARSTHDTAVGDPVQATAADSQSRAQTYATVANVCFVVGAIILATGLVWGIVDVAGSKRATKRLARGDGFAW